MVFIIYTGGLWIQVTLYTYVHPPRYSPSSRKSLKAYVMQLVNDQLGRHNMPADSVSRNLLKFLIASVGFPELRLLVAQKIDSWIQNPKVCTCVCGE